MTRKRSVISLKYSSQTSLSVYRIYTCFVVVLLVVLFILFITREFLIASPPAKKRKVSVESLQNKQTLSTLCELGDTGEAGEAGEAGEGVKSEEEKVKTEQNGMSPAVCGQNGEETSEHREENKDSGVSEEMEVERECERESEAGATPARDAGKDGSSTPSSDKKTRLIHPFFSESEQVLSLKFSFVFFQLLSHQRGPRAKQRLKWGQFPKTNRKGL